jgi:chloramphenicol-sensitive protein RarD
MIGILQYVNPSMQFVLGVVIFKEPFDHHRLIGFGIVWVALILFGVEGFLAQRRSRIGTGTNLVKIADE